MKPHTKDEENKWHNTTDFLILNDSKCDDIHLRLGANFDTWSGMKSGLEYGEVLYIEIKGMNRKKSFMAISLEQMKDLEKYLNQKIQYLESK